MEDKDKLWEESEIISTYSTKQAIEDGIIIDLRNIIKKINKGKEHYIGFITENLLNKGYIQENSEISLANILDLILQINNHIQKMYSLDGVYDEFYQLKIELPDGEKQKLFVVLNELEKFTLMLPEDY